MPARLLYYTGRFASLQLGGTESLSARSLVSQRRLNFYNSKGRTKENGITNEPKGEELNSPITADVCAERDSCESLCEKLEITELLSWQHCKEGKLKRIISTV